MEYHLIKAEWCTDPTCSNSRVSKCIGLSSPSACWGPMRCKHLGADTFLVMAVREERAKEKLKRKIGKNGYRVIRLVDNTVE